MNPTPSDDPVDPARAPLVVRRPEDLLAFVPVAVGFVPEHSAVMLTFGDRGSLFHARVDLPDDADCSDDLVDALLPPAVKHGVRAVLFVVYDDDTAVADEVAWSLRDAFVAEDIAVLDVLRVHDGLWYAVLPGRAPEDYGGVPFDVSSHPFTARAVFEGRVTRGSREDLRASIAAVAGAVETTEAALRRAVPLAPADIRPLVEHHLAAGTPVPTSRLAQLLVALEDPVARDEAWAWLERGQARAAVELWSDVVRRTPDEHLAAPAAVLGMVAWLSGEGALAWCAVDRCRIVAPGHTLAQLVAELLESATSPEAWSRLRPDPAA